MATYQGRSRTNYVVLRDKQAYQQFKALVHLLGGTTAETTQGGARRIAAFCEAEGGDLAGSVDVAQLLAAGYVSPHPGSVLDADRPAYRDPAASDDELDPHCDFLYEAYALLAPGQVLVQEKIGHEKLNYLAASARAINHKGEEVSLSLGDIYERAEQVFRVRHIPTAAEQG